MKAGGILMRGGMLLLLIYLAAPIQAQAENHEEDGGGEAKHITGHRQVLAGAFGFTFVPVAGGLGDTEARGVFVPSLGMEYTLNLGHRWGLGLMANYELIHYMIIDSQVEREHAFLSALVGKYYLSKHWTLFTGGGIEVEPHDHLAVLRMGATYSIAIGEHWKLSPIFYFDFKENYNTWSLEFAFGRKF